MRFTTAPGIMSLVERLARIPDRGCGTTGGAGAAEELARALEELGLEVREETFSFVNAACVSSLLVQGGRPLPHLPLSFAGAGHLRAAAVDGGTGEDDLVGREDVRGAIVVVLRDPVRHRQAQYQACVAAGAAGMVLVSSAPGDAIQEGSVREAWEGGGPIPCVAVGARTGGVLLSKLARGAVRLELGVEIEERRSIGRNLVAVVDGPGRARGIEVGAHYDAWGPGAVDNAGGCAALLACAEHLVREAPASPVTLVAFDGEEIGLLGAWYRTRRRSPGPGALLDLEMPSSREAVIRALAVTSAPACVEAAEISGLAACYDASGPMGSVPELMGGYVPADVWPYYLAGVGALVTVSDTPHYHTAGDRPETIDGEHLARVAEAAAACARLLSMASSDRLQGRDVPRAAIGAEVRGDELVVEATFSWEDGERATDDEPVEILAFAEDFRLLARVPARAAGSRVYQARIALPPGTKGAIDLTAHRTASGESAEAHLRIEP